jgi:hypothetical protein
MILHTIVNESANADLLRRNFVYDDGRRAAAVPAVSGNGRAQR